MAASQYEGLACTESESQSPLVPAWAIAPGVQAEIDKGNLHLDGLAKCLGPAIPSLRKVAVLSLLTQVYFLLGASSTAACDHKAGVTYSTLLWVPVLLVAIFRGLAEWQGVVHSAAPFAAMGGRFTMFGLTVPFLFWLVCNSPLSFLNLADLCTDSGFTAAVRKAVKCDAGDDMASLWLQTWMQSLPARAGVPAPDLPTLALLMWIITLLQIVLPFLGSIRKGDLSGKLRYTCGDWGQSEGALPCHNQVLYHDGVAFDLADASGMSVLQKIKIGYTKCGADANKDNLAWAVSYVAPLGHQMANMVIFSLIGESAFQLNLQTTIFGLNQNIILQAASGHHFLFAP